MSKPAISKHLRILEGAGLVTAEKRGQFVWYAIAHEQISTAIAHFLETVEPGVLEADKPPRPGTMPPRERRGSRLDRQRDRA